MVIEDLETSLGLSFKDRGLLRQALVHRSFLNEHNGSPLDSYERLEFLGDAVLELVISTELYQALPGLTEGELTKGRSSLVCRPSLARAARRLSLGSYLALGKGEMESGGKNRESILEEAFESIVAAIYLDQGYEASRQFILNSLGPELREYCQSGEPAQNPKSQLQELVQGLGQPTPRYQLVSSEGPDHQPVFTVEVLVGDESLAQGTGSRKSDAERAAAQTALETYTTVRDTESVAVSLGDAPYDANSSALGRETPSDTSADSDLRVNACFHSSSATGKATGKRPQRESGEVESAGSGVFSKFSGRRTLMKVFGKNSRKS